MKKRYVTPRMKVVKIELEQSAFEIAESLHSKNGDELFNPDQLIDADKNWGDDEDGNWR